jgi:hypothetical protein
VMLLREPVNPKPVNPSSTLAWPGVDAIIESYKAYNKGKHLSIVPVQPPFGVHRFVYLGAASFCNWIHLYECPAELPIFGTSLSIVGYAGSFNVSLIQFPDYLIYLTQFLLYPSSGTSRNPSFWKKDSLWQDSDSSIYLGASQTNKQTNKHFATILSCLKWQLV